MEGIFLIAAFDLWSMRDYKHGYTVVCDLPLFGFEPIAASCDLTDAEQHLVKLQAEYPGKHLGVFRLVATTLRDENTDSLFYSQRV